MINFTIDPDNGWLESQPKVTRTFIKSNLLKAQAKGTVAVSFKGAHFNTRQAPNRLDLADHLGTLRAVDFATVAPWRGQER